MLAYLDWEAYLSHCRDDTSFKSFLVMELHGQLKKFADEFLFLRSGYVYMYFYILNVFRYKIFKLGNYKY